jgi:tetratricopeptide (TPR) repeat protein
LAECYLETNELERALTACHEALAHAQETGDRKEEGIIYQVLGRVYLQRGDPAAALAHLEQSVAILRDLNRELDLGNALCDYAQALAELGQTALARKQLSSALDLFERLDLPQEQDRAQAALDQLG